MRSIRFYLRSIALELEPDLKSLMGLKYRVGPTQLIEIVGQSTKFIP